MKRPDGALDQQGMEDRYTHRHILAGAGRESQREKEVSQLLSP